MVARIEWIDRMRGLAILSVVVQHSVNNVTNNYVFHHMIGIANMGVFFFISGYVLNLTAHIGTTKEGMHFIAKKAIQLMLPFFIWPLVVNRYFFQKDWQMLSIEDVVNEITDPHLWFLLTLFGYCIVFAIGKRMLTGKSVLFWLLAVAAMFGQFKFTGSLKLGTLYMIYFAAGVVIGDSNRIDKIFSNRIVSALALLAFCLLPAY